MSSWGRCQDALHLLLWEMPGGYGTYPDEPGLLRDLEWERVSNLIDPIIEVVYPIAHDQGMSQERHNHKSEGGCPISENEMGLAIHAELVHLWKDLDSELGESRDWTERACNLASRIQSFTRIVGASDVAAVPPSIVEDGTFERLNKMVGAK